MKYETINNQLCRMVEQPCPHCGQPEIIAIPVADGSLEWALYQIRSGKKVVKEGGGERYVGSFYKNRLFYLNDYGCLVTKNARGLIDPCSEKEFLDLDKTGWQLYEPQPEPEPKESPIDPIERPLRNLILEAKEKGVNIRTWYQDLIFTPESLTSYLGNGKYRWWSIGNWELTKRKANMPMPEPQPEPEPELKVGDWVEHGNYQGVVEDVNGDIISVHDITTSGRCHDEVNKSCCRKLDPSEVVVDFGSGIKGTVIGCNNVMPIVKVLNGVDWIASIMLSALDAPTRSLVEKLLKAQEEK